MTFSLPQSCRVILTTLYALCLVSVCFLVFVGCGGDDEPRFKRDTIENNMTELHRGQLTGGATMDQLECVMDGDETHWRCFTYVRRSDGLYRLTTQVTCDLESGDCLSEIKSFTRA